MDEWLSRDLPVLHAVRDLEAEARAGKQLRAEDVGVRAGIDKNEVVKLLLRLARADYLDGKPMTTLQGVIDFYCDGLTEKGRRAVGQWPTQDPWAGLVELLSQQIEQEQDEDKRGRLVKLRDGVLGAGRSVGGWPCSRPTLSSRPASADSSALGGGWVSDCPNGLASPGTHLDPSGLRGLPAAVRGGGVPFLAKGDVGGGRRHHGPVRRNGVRHCRPDPARHVAAGPGQVMEEQPAIYVVAPTPMPVRVTVRGEVRDGEVLGWRGERVYVRWRTEAGNHLGWVPAADVERQD